MGLSASLPSPVAWFNSIAAQREAAVAELGWGLFPKYAVQRELDSDHLVTLPLSVRPEQFGIWVRRDDAETAPLVEQLTTWLRGAL